MMSFLHAEEGSPWGAWRARVSGDTSLELDLEHGGGQSSEADSGGEHQGQGFMLARR
jgi:hypothetical protein